MKQKRTNALFYTSSKTGTRYITMQTVTEPYIAVKRAECRGQQLPTNPILCGSTSLPGLHTGYCYGGGGGGGVVGGRCNTAR